RDDAPGQAANHGAASAGAHLRARVSVHQRDGRRDPGEEEAGAARPAALVRPRNTVALFAGHRCPRRHCRKGERRIDRGVLSAADVRPAGDGGHLVPAATGEGGAARHDPSPRGLRADGNTESRRLHADGARRRRPRLHRRRLRAVRADAAQPGQLARQAAAHGAVGASDDVEPDWRAYGGRDAGGAAADLGGVSVRRRHRQVRARLPDHDDRRRRRARAVGRQLHVGRHQQHPLLGRSQERRRRDLSHPGLALLQRHQHGRDEALRTPAVRASEPMSKDIAFEMAVSSVRYGIGVTREVGMDLAEMGAKNVMVLTDPHLARLAPVQTVVESLEQNGVAFALYDRVRIEPSDESFLDAIAFARERTVDAFVAVGGGSTIDTAKAVNLYTSWPPADFLDYVNPPIGKGLPVPGPLKPLMAIPTTAGTGSETTGVAIFDLKRMHAKTGIANR